MNSTPCLIAVLMIAASVQALPVAEQLVLWDNQPAKELTAAYPAGNGRLGAMPFGHFPQEMILINEETIWAKKDGYDTPADSFE